MLLSESNHLLPFQVILIFITFFLSHPDLYYLSEVILILIPSYQVILILYLLFELYPDSLFTLNLSNFLYLLIVLSVQVASRFPCFDDAKLRLFAYTNKNFIAFLTLFSLIFDVNQSVVCVHTTKLRLIWHTSKPLFDIHQRHTQKKCSPSESYSMNL